MARHVVIQKYVPGIGTCYIRQEVSKPFSDSGDCAVTTSLRYYHDEPERYALLRQGVAMKDVYGWAVVSPYGITWGDRYERESDHGHDNYMHRQLHEYLNALERAECDCPTHD